MMGMCENLTLDEWVARSPQADKLKRELADLRASLAAAQKRANQKMAEAAVERAEKILATERAEKAERIIAALEGEACVEAMARLFCNFSARFNGSCLVTTHECLSVNNHGCAEWRNSMFIDFAKAALAKAKELAEAE